MKNGVGYITLTDGKLHFLLRKDRNSSLLTLSTIAGDPEQALMAALNHAMDNGATLTRAVLAIDGRDCILRNYEIPIRNSRQLDQVVTFELEDGLPMQRDELVLDYFKGSADGDVSFISAAAVEKTHIAELVALFDSQSVSLEGIDIDVAAFARACANGFPSYERCIGLEIGNSRILFCLLHKGEVRKVAVIPWGTDALTTDFAEEGGLTEEEVDRIMLLGEGGDSDKQSRAARLFDDHMTKFLRKLLRETGRQLGGKEIPPRFVVSGDIVRAQRFREMFQEGFECTLDVWEEQCLSLGFEVDDGQRGSGLATGYGTAEASGGGFNLRKEEFALVGGQSGWVRELTYLASLLLCVVLAWTIYVHASLYGAQRDLDTINTATIELYKEAFPELGQDMAVMQYQSILASRVSAMSGDAAGSAEASSPAVIDTLRTISRTIKQNVDVEFVSLNMDSKGISIQGQAASMDEVDKIRASLSAAKELGTVRVKNATTDKRSGRIRFEIEVVR